MKTISLSKAMELTGEALPKGRALLTVGGDKPNTMTIGWGAIGWIWNKPIFMAVVRKQRHTHDILLKEGEFTVSMILDDSLKAQLAYAGTASGRDEDKFSGHGLTIEKAQSVSAPIVKECTLHIECKTRLVEEMHEGNMDTDVLNRCYPARDMHTMVFGEIVACYVTNE